MRCVCDPMGFPWLDWQKMRLQVGLWPIAKVQFERYLAEPTLGNEWYEDLVSLSPRVSLRRFTPEEREYHFLTGIHPDEALGYAKWLGNEYDLPTCEEWRELDRQLASETLPPLAELVQTQGLGVAACSLLQHLYPQTGNASWRELMLLRGGLVEWVRRAKGFVGLGSPRAEFWANTFEPQHDEIRPLGERRLRYFGFRLLRRLGH